MSDEIKATIQLDKLELCCRSTIDDNFNDAIKYYPDEAFKTSHSFGRTTITQTIDKKRQYKFSYDVYYDNFHFGRIDFCRYGQPHKDDLIWFSIYNPTFYNGIFQYLPRILDSLNLTINNITRIEIALDSYNFDHEQIIRRGYRNRDNFIKIMGRNVKDRNEDILNVSFRNSGSPNNPFKYRNVYVKNNRLVKYNKTEEDSPGFEEMNKTVERKTTIQLVAYDKLEEIRKHSPHKVYIIDYHKAHNPKFKHIYRLEIRLEYEEIRRYQSDKIKKLIEVSDLLDKEFLYNMFVEYVDRIIVIRDNKKHKIELFPVPFLGSSEGRLPITLPEVGYKSQSIINKEFDDNKIENDNSMIMIVFIIKQ